MQTEINVNAAAVVNAPAAPVAVPPSRGLVEARAHGSHALRFQFKPDVEAAGIARDGMWGIAWEAIDNLPMVQRLRAAAGLLAESEIEFGHGYDYIEMKASKKDAYPMIDLVMRSIVGETTPDQIEVEVVASMREIAQRRAVVAKARAVVEVATKAARVAADAALADEIADVQARYATLVAKHNALCAEQMRDGLAKPEAFAGFDDDAEAVQKAARGLSTSVVFAAPLLTK